MEAYLTEQEIDDLSREMVKGCKSVNWLAKKIESAVLERLKAQEPFAYFSINDYGAWEETSDPTAHALYEHPDPRIAELEAVLRECRKELNGVLNGKYSGNADRAIAKIDEVLNANT